MAKPMTSGTIVWTLKVEKLNISFLALYKAIKNADK